ncbi:hypothetical protein ACOMHN_044201 [Nucella lapillus]
MHSVAVVINTARCLISARCGCVVPVVRKHGKLMSFLRTFFSTRPPRNQLKQSGIVKERVFGCDLGEHLLNSGHDVPVVLKCCTEVIERYGVVDGIYRLSGVASNIQKLRVAFDEDEAPDLTESVPFLQDIHSISSLLKMYFRELPNPLLTYQLYQQFAEAVQDEDNRLIRIYDVVQQLPPPHYRTLQYLMQHLSRVASHASQTGMHSKNLAIVWAPNLLRSKELEQGGGAAALQGVGIQAVVTECLICYSDFIFTDTSPSSPDTHKAEKKPRPRSLAMASPTRLLSLAEARGRALSSSMAPPAHRFIHVGGGGEGPPPCQPPSTPSSTSPHTGQGRGTAGRALVWKRQLKDVTKGKRSPVSGWKSIFSKPRAASVRKTRKGGTLEDDKGLQSSALTDGDGQPWKRRLRSAKSVESLVSPPHPPPWARAQPRPCSTPTTAGAEVGVSGGVSVEEGRAVFHKRSLSSDGSGVRRPSSPVVEVVTSPSLDSTAEPSSPGGHRSRRTERRADRSQSFVRGDSTRMARHRRTPSAPNLPRTGHDRTVGEDGREDGAMRAVHKSSSQPHLDSLLTSPDARPDWVVVPGDDGLGVDIDAAIRAKLRARDPTPCPPHAPTHAPSPPGQGRERSPLGRGKGGVLGEGVVELQASPGCHRRHPHHSPSSPPDPTHTRFFVSRYHDYAEIESSGEGEEEEEDAEKLDRGDTDSRPGGTSGELTPAPHTTPSPTADRSPPPLPQDGAGTHVAPRSVERVLAGGGGGQLCPALR